MDPIEAFARAAETEWLGVLKPQTADTYRLNLDQWLAHCRQRGLNPFEPPRLAPKEFVESMRSKAGLPYAPLTVRRVIAALSSAYNAVLPDGRNPFARRVLRRPDADYEPTQIIQREDIDRLIEAAGGRGETPIRDVAILEVLRSTGMRRAGIASMRREVVWRDGVMNVLHRVKGKGEPDYTEVSPEAARAIEAWLRAAPPSKWMFVRLDGGRPKGGQCTGRRRAPEVRDRYPPLSPSAITKIVARAARAAGIHAHPHAFRATAATDALDAGIPIEKVRSYLRWKDVRMVLRYDRGQRGGGVAAELAAARRRGTAKTGE